MKQKLQNHHLNIVSPAPEMIKDIETVREANNGRVEKSSFYRIPSIWSFKVFPGKENTILRGTGLDRKLESRKKAIIHRDQNAASKFMAFKIRKLRLLLLEAGRPDLF